LTELYLSITFRTDSALSNAREAIWIISAWQTGTVPPTAPSWIPIEIIQPISPPMRIAASAGRMA
jgi:hypothetical protein